MPPTRKKKKYLKRCLVFSMLLSPLISLLLQLRHITQEGYDGSRLNESTVISLRDPEKERPGIRSLLTIPDGNIIGDPQFLLDVAIVGFPKCGTTALQDFLSQHPQIQMLEGEPFPLMYRKPYLLIWKLYKNIPADTTSMHFVRGYKNPLDIRCPTCMNYLSTLFSKTSLIIGLRHPVLWFESLYNFKVQNLPPHVNPAVFGDPNDLIDECEDFMNPDCVGTAKAWFHVHLASLGKVAFPDEWRMEYPRYLQNVSQFTRVPNSVFLYEVTQLKFDALVNNRIRNQNQNNNTMQLAYSNAFRRDLADYLKLESPLDMDMSQAKPDNYNLTQRQQRRKDRHKINICDSKYKGLRSSLMDIARRSSKWIRLSFLDSPDVKVSSRPYFEFLLEQWMFDPCQESGHHLKI